MFRKIEFSFIKEELCDNLFNYFIKDDNILEEIENIYDNLYIYFNDEDFCCCYIADEIMTALKSNGTEDNINKARYLFESLSFYNKNNNNINFNNILKDFENQSKNFMKNTDEIIENLKTFYNISTTNKFIHYYFLKKLLSTLIETGLYIHKDKIELYVLLRKEYNSYVSDSSFMEKFRFLKYFKY